MNTERNEAITHLWDTDDQNTQETLLNEDIYPKNGYNITANYEDMSIKLRGNARVRRWTSIDNGPNGFQAKKKSKVTEINTI